ncbi:sensor histidine kinase [Vibrio sp. JPW-9-11-11]|uniref:ATP-binding protein n=1 Tax=Vibrio sp. JPW-9-11-11 TaxID=1416532 RepID=UPI0015937589|nr:sensor histidine kinase [Vibrio sp. JPW-9-11-11]NVD06002.1 sensor histidine kinase [Vibrio sp. JPW-9-11-11]
MATRIFPRSFTMHLTILLCGALTLGSIGWWLVATERLNQVLDEQVALRAQVQTQQLAQLPSLIAAVKRGDKDQVGVMIRRLQQATDADFITVSDERGIRLAHPLANRVGLPVVGGDIERALTTGDSYLSYSVGSLGPSVRYISPLIDDTGTIVGMIKVGYLLQTIAILNEQTLSPLILFTIVSVLLSGLAAWRFSEYIRDKMQHMEPWQLQQTLQTSAGVLQAAHEGILALNAQGEVYLCNDSAQELLGIDKELNLPQPLSNLLADPQHFRLHGSDFIDRLVRINGRNLVLTRVTLALDPESERGAVFSLRAQKELQLLSNKISQVSSYLESIRVTRHEHQNKLSTVTGLLQLGHVDQALEMLLSQSQTNQANMDSVAQLQSLPLISGLLLSHLGKAAEKNIHVDLSELHGWQALPNKLDEQALSSLLANLINNSIEALEGSEQGQIRVVMYQTPSERVLAVANNGPMIQVSLDSLCQLGFTTKSDFHEHGIGMHLVQSVVEAAEGYIELDSDQDETQFTIYFPEVRNA